MKCAPKKKESFIIEQKDKKQKKTNNKWNQAKELIIVIAYKLFKRYSCQNTQICILSKDAFGIN